MSFLRILKNQHYRRNNSVKLEAEENKLEKLFIYMYINNLSVKENQLYCKRVSCHLSNKIVQNCFCFHRKVTLV